MADGTPTAPVKEPCQLDIHKEIWDLTGTLTAETSDASNPNEPSGVIHTDQTLHVVVTLTLGGKILNYLCNTQVGVGLGFESCGPGVEFDESDWKTLEPCAPGGNVIVFTFDVPGSAFGTVPDTGREYTLCITVGSKDCCGKSGFLYGHCHDFHITVLPADVDD
jgi:hypothetical protein